MLQQVKGSLVFSLLIDLIVPNLSATDEIQERQIRDTKKLLKPDLTMLYCRRILLKLSMTYLNIIISIHAWLLLARKFSLSLIICHFIILACPPPIHSPRAIAEQFQCPPYHDQSVQANYSRILRKRFQSISLISLISHFA